MKALYGLLSGMAVLALAGCGQPSAQTTAKVALPLVSMGHPSGQDQPHVLRMKEPPRQVPNGPQTAVATKRPTVHAATPARTTAPASTASTPPSSPSGLPALRFAILAEAPVPLGPEEGVPLNGGYAFLKLQVTNRSGASVTLNAFQDLSSGVPGTITYSTIDDNAVPPSPSLFPIPAEASAATLVDTNMNVVIPAHGVVTGWIEAPYLTLKGNALFFGLRGMPYSQSYQVLPFSPPS